MRRVAAAGTTAAELAAAREGGAAAARAASASMGEDGALGRSVTLATFQQFARGHPALLFPAFQLQAALQVRFWFRSLSLACLQLQSQPPRSANARGERTGYGARQRQLVESRTGPRVARQTVWCIYF
jgi:hypothetical protein